MAVRAWRKVQVLRPSSSTSGGQSDRGGAGCGGGGVVVVVVVYFLVVVVEEEEVWAFIIAAQEATEVQERQLDGFPVCEIGFQNGRLWVGKTYGLPSLPNTTPLGNFLGGSVLDEAVLELEACSSMLSDMSPNFDEAPTRKKQMCHGRKPLFNP